MSAADEARAALDSAASEEWHPFGKESAKEKRIAITKEKLDALGVVLSPSVASGDTVPCSESTARPADRPADDGNDDDDGKSAKQTTANALIEMAVKHCDLFHDERNDGYAVTTYKGIRRTLKLRGREFRRWLAGLYYAETERAANNEAIATALSVLEAKATFDGKMLELRCDVFVVDMQLGQFASGGAEGLEVGELYYRRNARQFFA